MRRLVTILPIYCTGQAVTYTCLSLVGAMTPFGSPSPVWVPAAVGEGRRSFVRAAVPGVLRSLVYRFLGETYAFGLLEKRVLASLRSDDILYLWPGTAPSLRREIVRRGYPIVTERINCAQATAKRVLDAEYERVGWTSEDPISEEQVEFEREELAVASRVFSPSPRVVESLREVGVESERILESSYGFDPGRIAGTSRALPPFDGLTVVFVGYACIRKGMHLLFEAFERAGLRARLVLAGRIAPSFRERYAGFLARPDVLALGHVSDIGAVYRCADVFVFPSLEEGGPMVTYEAMGAGLPVLVSPMGAGAIARDAEDGFVVDPHDVEGLAAALTRLAEDRELREALGRSARERAAEFTWERVAARRQRMLEEAFGKLP